MQIIQATKQPNWAVAFSPCGSWFAAGGGTADVRLWGTDLGAKPKRIPDTRRAMGLAFGPDGFLRVSCLVRIPRAFRVPDGNLVGAAEGAFGPQSRDCVGFGPDGTVTHAANGELGVWDPVRRTELWRVRRTGQWLRVACGPGRYLATVSTPSELRKWDRETGDLLNSALVKSEKAIADLAFSPDGRTLAVAVFDHIILWDVATWTERARYLAECRKMTYHPAGTALLGFDGFSGTGVVHVWDPDTGAERAAYDFGVRAAVSLAIDARGERAAIGGFGGRIVVWDLDRRAGRAGRDSEVHGIDTLSGLPDAGRNF